MGTLVGCLLLALVWWMVRNLGGAGPGYGTITVDDPALRRMAEESARAEVRRRERLAKRELQEASVPWMRNAMLPEPASVESAALPFAMRRSDRPLSVHVYAARLPHLPRHRTIRAPDEAVVPTANGPWRNNLPAVPDSVNMSLAGVPWTAGRTIGQAPEVIVMAQVPPFRPRPDPAKPWPARVPEAQSPWARDAASPQERHVYEAHVPSRLRAMTPDNQ